MADAQLFISIAYVLAVFDIKPGTGEDGRPVTNRAAFTDGMIRYISLLCPSPSRAWFDGDDLVTHYLSNARSFRGTSVLLNWSDIPQRRKSHKFRVQSIYLDRLSDEVGRYTTRSLVLVRLKSRWLFMQYWSDGGFLYTSGGQALKSG